ncbi:unnamed protein product [Medioppia subpectinata]|uniref:long-chain-fatty-acid--CoA ligase n=1 Tax=Medioppia subpectinata TaxID=1979941 RepID=A0A7R9KTD3_9ACAR|nr:unnamed protein product [Medioppia subpectinata]CAG2109457.1 unnamed protein product [Medioppia subpectinata]
MIWFDNTSVKSESVVDVDIDYKPEMIDLNNQSNHIDKTTRCSSMVQRGKYLLTCEPQIKTLLDCVYRGYKISKDNDCLGLISPYTQAYEWSTYSQLMIAEYACYHYSMAVVALFDTSESNRWTYIFQQIEPKCVIVDSNERAKQVMTSVRYNSKVESLILTSDHLYPDTKLLAEKKVISYTSGTTGNPKGALLTHGNLVSAVSALLLHLDSHFDLREETMIAYLSSAQLRERILKACMFYSGGRIGIYSGDFKDLSRELPILMPTIMYCVPRILNRLYNRVISKVRGNWVRSRMLDIALKSKQPEILKAVNQTTSIWDKVVFNTVKQTLGGNLKLLISGSSQISSTVLNFVRNSFGCRFFAIKQTLGGNLKLLISGSSQISSTVLNFVRNSFGCRVLECYGLTECSAFVTLTHCADQSYGKTFTPIGLYITPNN